MAQRVGRPCNPIIDSLGDALVGGSDDLNDLVDCIRHFGLPWIMFPPSLRLRVGLETLSQYTRMIVPKRDSNRLSRPDRQTQRRRTGSPAHSIGATAGATPAIYRYPVQVPRANLPGQAATRVTSAAVSAAARYAVGSPCSKPDSQRGKPFRHPLDWPTMYAGAGAYCMPSARATAGCVIRPSSMFSPSRKCGSPSSASRHPLSAKASTNGKVAFVSAKVEVRATAPGMLVTQ